MFDQLNRLFDQLNRVSDWFQQGEVDLGRALVGLVLALGLAQILSWHYVRFARVLSNKRKFARMFIFIAVTTLLIITVVKSSLALSLGLVGALSIIRFRTPIKEPEELAYLFLAIATGIGMGAGQEVVTIVVFAVLLGYMSFRRPDPGTAAGSGSLRTIVQVSAPINGRLNGSKPSGEIELKALLPAVSEPCRTVDLRRVDCHGSEFNASLLVEVKSDQIGVLLSRIQEALPGATVSVVERDGLE